MALFGKKSSDSSKSVAVPKAFTIQIDPSKFNLATKPSGPVHEQLETLKQKLTKLSSNVENNLMLVIRASTKKDKALASSAFEFDERYIQKGKFEVEYLTLAYLNFQQLDEADRKTVAHARMILKELERIAQFCLNIADKTEYIQLANIQVLHKDEYDLKLMGDDTAEMIKKAVEAFVSGNSKHATETLDMMKKIDDLYQKAVAKLKAEVNDSNIINSTGILSVVEHVHTCAEISCAIARHFC
ncbi:MAG TPA: transcriptional regulator [Chlorobaculum sp.]|jgi:phosphate uptake regulator|uniref:Transcriptional regulator, putative n=1 Tax=Chlorobaculum tepidum (strain ATCC 49652 / DSM 12025 / NBRC 103806 / TLS) TaxID=194439 RepID=Q8KDZ1_CHLTE|nr:transcriptional regulator [Chlorobaculum tepidum]AAM72138.1 transcriptional regulator, putative [Chlorobaculum tepidum TLS]HBU23134.1 transcriptional regulator [Chlorobaculum sp.]